MFYNAVDLAAVNKRSALKTLKSMEIKMLAKELKALEAHCILATASTNHTALVA